MWDGEGLEGEGGSSLSLYSPPPNPISSFPSAGSYMYRSLGPGNGYAVLLLLSPQFVLLGTALALALGYRQSTKFGSGVQRGKT